MRIWESCGRMVWRFLGAIVRSGLAPRTSSARASPVNPKVRSRIAMPQRTDMGNRSLRGSSHGPLKTPKEFGDRLLPTGQYSIFKQDCDTRMWIEAAQHLAGE